MFADRYVEDHMRERWIKGWIGEAQARLARKQIPALYWNTLIGTQKLAPLDQDWHNLGFLLLWLRLDASLGGSRTAETPVPFVIARALLSDIHRNRETALFKTHVPEQDSL